MRSNKITFLTTHLMRIKNTSNMWHLCIYLWLESKVSSNVLTTLTLPLTRVKLKSNNFDSAYHAHQRWIKYVISLQISLIRIKIWLHLWRAWIKCGLCHLWFQSKVIKGGLWQSLTTHLMCAKAFFRAERVQHYAVDSLLSQRIKYNRLVAQNIANFWSCSKSCIKWKPLEEVCRLLRGGEIKIQ